MDAKISCPTISSSLNRSDPTSGTRPQPLECSYFHKPKVTGVQPTLMRPSVLKRRELEYKTGKGKKDTDID